MNCAAIGFVSSCFFVGVVCIVCLQLWPVVYAVIVVMDAFQEGFV